MSVALAVDLVVLVVTVGGTTLAALSRLRVETKSGTFKRLAWAGWLVVLLAVLGFVFEAYRMYENRRENDELAASNERFQADLSAARSELEKAGRGVGLIQKELVRIDPAKFDVRLLSVVPNRGRPDPLPAFGPIRVEGRIAEANLVCELDDTGTPRRTGGGRGSAGTTGIRYSLKRPPTIFGPRGYPAMEDWDGAVLSLSFDLKKVELWDAYWTHYVDVVVLGQLFSGRVDEKGIARIPIRFARQ